MIEDLTFLIAFLFNVRHGLREKMFILILRMILSMREGLSVTIIVVLTAFGHQLFFQLHTQSQSVHVLGTLPLSRHTMDSTLEHGVILMCFVFMCMHDIDNWVVVVKHACVVDLSFFLLIF